MGKLANIARMTTATTGTGTVTLGSAVSGYITFANAGVSNGDIVTYVLEEGANREIGTGTYTSSGTTLSRDTVLNSTAGGTTKITLAGAATAFITAAAQDIRSTEVAASPSANSNDYSPAGHTAAGPSAFIRLTPTATINITGLANGYSGCRRTIMNALDGTSSAGRLLILSHEDSSSTAANRFFFPDRMPRFLMPGDSVELAYDATAQRWRPLGYASFTNVFQMWSDLFNASPWTSVSTGTGAATALPVAPYLSTDATQKPQGTVSLSTGTTNSGATQFGTAALDFFCPAQGSAFYLTRVAALALSTVGQEYNIVSGFQDRASTNADVTDGVYWEYLRTTSVNWSYNCAGAGTRSKTASSVAVDTNYVWLAIYVNGDWSQADFIISQDGRTWTVAGSQSGGNMPTATEIVGFGTSIRKSAGTTAVTTELDFLGYRYDAYRGA